MPPPSGTWSEGQYEVEPAAKQARCLFCSLGCRCRIALRSRGYRGEVEPGQGSWATVTHEDGNGLCARAFYMGDLMWHPERLDLATRRCDGQPVRTSVDEALDALAERIGPDAPTAAIIDGNYPTQAIAATLDLCAGAANTVGAVYLPAGDSAMLVGLDAAGWTQGARPGPANDLVLVIGDAFSAHPPIARNVLDSKQAARGHQLLVVSPFRGRTAAFATRATLVPPGGEAALLLAVAKRLDADVPMVDTSVEAPGAEAIAEALRGARSPAIVLSQPEGTTANAHVAALAAARIAAALGAPLLPLFTYGNALGAWRAAAEHGAAPLAEVVADAKAGRIENLVVLGVDLAAALPGDGAQMLEASDFVVAAQPFTNATTARADVVLPLGLWCEEAGEATLSDGEAVGIPAPAGPPRGALTVDELVQALAERLSLDEANRTPPSAPPEPSWQLAPAPGEGMTLIAAVDALGFADGSLSSRNWWAASARREPSITLHPADCKRTGLAAGSTAAVTIAGGEARLAVECSEDVPPGVASVPLCFAATRELFRWELDPQAAPVRCGPAEVTIGATS